MDAYIEERLKQHIEQQLVLERALGRGVHRYLLARRLLGAGGDGGEEAALIRAELGIKGRKATSGRSEGKTEGRTTSVQTASKAVEAVEAVEGEPAEKAPFDDMFGGRPRQRRAMSKEPATFQSADEMAAGQAGAEPQKGDLPPNSLQDAVKSTAQRLEREANAASEAQNQPREDPYIKRLVESGIVVTPKETLSSIFGMANEKRLLTQTIILPLQRPELFRNMTIQKKILLHSLPGCGKTFIVRCISGETHQSLISMQSSSIFNKYIGESERYLRSAFALARSRQPSILFIDEIDAFCKMRSDSDSETTQRVKNELLQLIDGLDGSRVTLIGATNLPYALDPAVRRRFEKRVFVSLPDDEARRRFLGAKLAASGGFLERLVASTSRYNFADLNNVVNSIQALPIEVLTAARHFRRAGAKWEVCEAEDEGAMAITVTEIPQGEEVQIPAVSDEQKLQVLQRVRGSVEEGDMKLHQKFQAEFGSA